MIYLEVLARPTLSARSVFFEPLAMAIGYPLPHVVALALFVFVWHGLV